MKISIGTLSSLFLFLSFCAVSEQFDCTQIADKDQEAGKLLNIPDNSQVPVAIPVNFNCTYTIKPPKLVYAQITVTNNLSGINDVIFVTGGQQQTTKLNRNSANTDVFYVFPQTTTTVNIQNFDAASKFRMVVNYIALPNPQKTSLQKGSNLNYYNLNSIQKKPITISSDGPMSLTLARSGYFTDKFDNFFVIDGDMENQKSVKRLVDYTTSNFNSSGNMITLVGLDGAISHSSFILNPSSELIGYTKFRGITVDVITGDIDVSASEGEKVAVMIVAKDIQQLVLNEMVTRDESYCKAMAVTGPPNSESKTLIDFQSDQYSLPQLFPYPYFSIIAENCGVQFTFTTQLPANYYKMDNERSGFIFSPAYFNSEAMNGYSNITFAYTGVEKLQFAVDVDRVTLNPAMNSELDINIYDSGWKKTLSTVITGNQEGTRSAAFGAYLNVQMSGYTAAKLHWQLSSFSIPSFNFPLVILIAAIISMISN